MKQAFSFMINVIAGSMVLKKPARHLFLCGFTSWIMRFRDMPVPPMNQLLTSTTRYLEEAQNFSGLVMTSSDIVLPVPLFRM